MRTLYLRVTESVQGVQHSVPDGDHGIEVCQFTKNFCREDEAVYDSLKQGWDLELEGLLQHTWNEEQGQYQKTGDRDIVVVQHHASDADQNHQ